MSKQTPIPMSSEVLWREFRFRYLPLITLVITGIAAVILWRQTAGNSLLSGLGEGRRSNVNSPQSGTITAVMVKPYQMVKKGDPVAILQPYDMQAELDLLSSGLEISRLRSQPTISEQNAMNYERMRLELFREKCELAIARAKLKLAEKDQKRNRVLYDEKLLSENVYEFSERERAVYQAEVDEKVDIQVLRN